jgi:type IV pilus assembly protein PilF
MANISYLQGSYLRARAFLQRYEAVGAMNEESLILGYDIEMELGDQQAANRYRQELMERYPGSAQVGRNASQERR